MATLTAERWTREMVEMLVDGDTIDFGLGKAHIISTEQLNPKWARAYAPYCTILAEVKCQLNIVVRPREDLHQWVNEGVVSICIYDGCTFSSVRPIHLDRSDFTQNTKALPPLHAEFGKIT